jgi:hypothetical protein
MYLFASSLLDGWIGGEHCNSKPTEIRHKALVDASLMKVEIARFCWHRAFPLHGSQGISATRNQQFYKTN